MSLIKQLLDNVLGIFFFKNLNTLSINLYNYASKVLIFDKNYEKGITSFVKDGYQKIGSCNKVYLDKIKIECEKQIPTGFEKIRFEYVNNQIIVESVKKIINENCSNFLNSLEKYYRSNIKLSWFEISRNYHFSSHEEQYSNYFHTDGYTNNLIKVFINLHDVSLSEGPLQLIKKRFSKKFLKISKINKLRRVYKVMNEEKLKDFSYLNVGKEGDIFLCDTTDLIHRANIPEKNNFRDILSLEFIALPQRKKINNFFSLENDNKNIYYNKDNYFSKEFAKSKGLKNLILKFSKYKQSSKTFND